MNVHQKEITALIFVPSFSDDGGITCKNLLVCRDGSLYYKPIMIFGDLRNMILMKAEYNLQGIGINYLILFIDFGSSPYFYSQEDYQSYLLDSLVAIVFHFKYYFS